VIDDFEAFVTEHEPLLRRALIGARGPAEGREATAEALAYGWEHWTTVKEMANPLGYLYRVGQSRTRRRKVPTLARAVPTVMPEVEPGLAPALARLTATQRVAVFLVHGCDWSHAEVARVLDVAPSTVATHVQRGMSRLRELLEVSVDA